MNIADINTETRALVDADSVSYPDALLLIRTNEAYEKVVAKILGCDGRWDFDDTNYTTFPVATANLVASQQDYAFDVSHLKIIGASVKTNSGIWRELIPFDPDDLNASAGPQDFTPLVNFPPIDRAEFLKTPGSPQYYDKLGNSLLLYPAPDNGVSVTLIAGLKVYFQRTASIFTTGDVSTGTKLPGFASPFHSVISYMAALPYAMSYKKDRVPMLLAEITKVMGDEEHGIQGSLERFYSKRDRSERTIMTPRRIKYI